MKTGKIHNPFVITLILIFIIFMTIYLSNTLILVSKYTITSAKIPLSFNNFKIVQLSDLHSASFGNDNQVLIKKIISLKPNIIVMTGDMVNSEDKNFDVFLHLAKSVSQKYRTYYVIGNHEQNLKDSKLTFLTNQLASMGIKVLNNTKIELSNDNEKINLYGMWFNLKYYKDVSNSNTKNIYFDETKMQKITGNCDSKRFNILLTHDPLYFETYNEWGADLTLSGHIHGGIIRIPFIGGLLSPERKFFPKYSAGEYHMNSHTMIVNRGLGNGNFGIRIFDNPDISVITLKSSVNK